MRSPENLSLPSIPRQLQIADTGVTAAETDRALPIGKARSVPGALVQRAAFYRQRELRDRDLPPNRKLVAVDIDARARIHFDVARTELPRSPVGRDPVAGDIVVSVGLPHPVQHQLLACRKMQREPVPAFLIRRQRLAA